MLIEGSDSKDAGTAGAGDYDIPAAITDTGCERELNEDRYAVIESESGLAWLVCDGMGGQTGGELAAQLAIDAIRRDLESLPPRSPDVALRSSFSEANRVIVLRRQNQAFAEMGTTIVGALFHNSEVAIGHVGDSRAYLVRDGAIQQLTTDHTYVQQLVDSGSIKAEDALSHPQAHILTRCVGAEPRMEIDISKFWMWECEPDEKRDHLVLCSDGLYSLVSEGEIANILTQETPQRACARLVEIAKERGGFDNITLAIIPLDGQLRQEPPAGYEQRRNKLEAKRRKEIEKSQIAMSSAASGDFLRTFGVVFVLSALAVLLTVLVMAFRLTQ